MGWFGGRSDSVETMEQAQEIVTRTSDDLAKKKVTVKSLRAAGVRRGPRRHAITEVTPAGRRP